MKHIKFEFNYSKHFEDTVDVSDDKLKAFIYRMQNWLLEDVIEDMENSEQYWKIIVDGNVINFNNNDN